MRVAVVTTSYPSNDGDPSGHFVHAEVAELERAGADVIVVRPTPGRAFGWPGVAERIRARPWYALDAGAWMTRASLALREARPQRVIAHWSLPSAFPVAAAGLAGRRDVDLEVVSHGGDIRLLLALPRPVRSRIVKRIAARATTWRFVSTALCRELMAGLDAREVGAVTRIAKIAPSPLAMIDVRDESAVHRRRFAGRRLYVCASRLVRTKRIDKVIDYVASKPHDGALRTLVVVGDGPRRPDLERLARSWGLDVEFIGVKSRRETLAWLAAADEVVHASEAEGLSTVVREAEHLGVAVTMLP